MNFLLLNIQEDNGRCHSSNLEKVGQSQTIYKEKNFTPWPSCQNLNTQYPSHWWGWKTHPWSWKHPWQDPCYFSVIYLQQCSTPCPLYICTLLHLSNERFPMGSINGYCSLWYWIPNIIGTNMVFHHMSCHPWQVLPLFFNDPFISVWL